MVDGDVREQKVHWRRKHCMEFWLWGYLDYSLSGGWRLCWIYQREMCLPFIKETVSGKYTSLPTCLSMSHHPAAGLSFFSACAVISGGIPRRARVHTTPPLYVLSWAQRDDGCVVSFVFLLPRSPSAQRLAMPLHRSLHSLGNQRMRQVRRQDILSEALDLKKL